jgi:enoyl-CoA hydratase/carnithine racemase
MIDITDTGRIRTIRLARPEAKNAMNEALWDATAEAFIDAAADRSIAVTVLTGTGDAFCAGQDVIEMALQASGDPSFQRGEHGFVGLCATLAEFPKPMIAAVNGMGLGFGATVLGFADLAFMATTARLKCPFTSLGVAPEFASSYTFPQLMGRQHATWALMSSEWLSAEECLAMGLVFKVAEPDELMAVTMAHAEILASKPISSLMECKRVIVEASRDEVIAARKREDDAFKILLGAPANIEAMRAFAEKREPDFSAVDD